MKTLATVSIFLLAPCLVLAQSAASPKPAAAAPTAATTAPAGAPAQAAAKAPVKKKPSASRTEIKSKASNMAAGIEAADEALSPAEMAIAERIHVGTVPCELGASVTLASDPKAPGYFTVQGKNFKYRMFPVTTSTGAIRLEDRNAGAVWLQLANKSMLMNQKAGKRLADECMSPVQLLVAENMKTSPGPGLLDAPRAAASSPLALDATALPAPALAPATLPVSAPN